MSAQVAAGLRAWARGCASEEAAVELLVRGFGGRFATITEPWVRRCDRPGWWWLDGDRLLDPPGYLSSGERAYLTLTGALVTAAAVPDLGGLLAGLDRPRLALVLAGFAHAAGSHTETDITITAAGVQVRRLPPLVDWPAPALGVVA